MTTPQREESCLKRLQSEAKEGTYRLATDFATKYLTKSNEEYGAALSVLVLFVKEEIEKAYKAGLSEGRKEGAAFRAGYQDMHNELTAAAFRSGLERACEIAEKLKTKTPQTVEYTWYNMALEAAQEKIKGEINPN